MLTVKFNIKRFADASFGRHTIATNNHVLVCQQGSCRDVPISRISTVNLQSPNLQIYVRDRSGRLKRLPQFTVRSRHSGRVVKRCRFSNVGERYFCKVFPIRRREKNCYLTRVIRTSCYHRFKCRKYTVVKRKCPVKGRVRLKCPNNITLARLDYYRTKCMRLVYRCSYSESTKCKHIRHKCQKIANFLKHCPARTKEKRSKQRSRRKYKPCASNYHRCRSRGYGLKTCLDRYSRCSKLLRCSKVYSRCARRRNRPYCRVRHRRCRQQVHLEHLSANRHLALMRRKRRKLCRKLYDICRQLQYSNRVTCRRHYSKCLLSARNQTGSGAISRLGRNLSVQKCNRLQKYTVKCKFVMTTCKNGKICKKSLMLLCQRVLKTIRLCREIQKKRKCLHFRSYRSRCSRVLQICNQPGSFCSLRYVRVCQKLIRVVHQCQKNLTVADSLDRQTYHENHHRHLFYHSHHHHHRHHHHRHHNHRHHNHRHHNHRYHQRYHRHNHDQHEHHQYQFVNKPRLFSVCKKIIVYRQKCANLIKYCKSDLYPNPRVCKAKYMRVCKKALNVVKSCTVSSTRQYKYHQHAFQYHYHHSQIRRGRSCSEEISKRTKCHRLIRACSKSLNFYSSGRTCSRKYLKGCYEVLRLARMCHHDKFSSTHKHYYEILHDHRRVLYPKCKRQTDCSSTIRYSNQCKSRIEQCRTAGETNIKKCFGVYGDICLKLIRYQRHCCSQYRPGRTQSSHFHKDPPIEKRVHRSTDHTLSKDTSESKDKVEIRISSEKLIHDRDDSKKYHHHYPKRAQLNPRIKVKHGKWFKSKATQTVHSLPKLQSELEVGNNSKQPLRVKSSHQKYFKEYQTCSRNFRVHCKDKKCKNRQTVLLLQSVCYFRFYSKMMCSRIRRAREKCGISSSTACKRIRSANSRHCRGRPKDSGESPCRTAKKTLTSCYQLQITKCNYRNKYRCHMGAARFCKTSLEYQHNLSRCKKWSQRTRKKRCRTLKKSLKFCHRVRCGNFRGSSSFCQLKMLKCKYIVKLHAVSCQKQALKKEPKQRVSSDSSKKQSYKKSNLNPKRKPTTTSISVKSSTKLAKHNIINSRLVGREQHEKNTDMKNRAKNHRETERK